MKVKQVMHRDVTWCEASVPITEIAKLMKTEDIGAVPIGENDKLIGMVTDRDIACRGIADDGDPKKVCAKDVMSKDIIYCTEDEDLEDAIYLMQEYKIRRLPVLNDEKRIVGMLGLGDISHIVASDLSGILLRSVSAHH